MHWGPKDVPDRGRVAIVSDPQGALFALVRASGGDPPDQVPLPGGWLWTELWTRDLAAALSFYESLAGYTHETTDVISGDEYHLLKRDDRARAGVRQLRWEDVRPNWLPYVLVDDPATVVARVDGLGGLPGGQDPTQFRRLFLEPDLLGLEPELPALGRVPPVQAREGPQRAQCRLRYSRV